MLYFLCKLSFLRFFFWGWVGGSGPKIVNNGLYICLPTNQYLHRDCRPQYNSHCNWKSGIWPCSRCTPRRSWVAWYHARTFRSCKLSFSALSDLHQYTTLLASLFSGHSFCRWRIPLYRRCSRFANVSTFGDFAGCIPRVLPRFSPAVF